MCRAFCRRRLRRSLRQGQRQDHRERHSAQRGRAGLCGGLNMVGRKAVLKGVTQINVLDTLGLISTSFGNWEGVPGGEHVELTDTDHKVLSLQFDGDVMVGCNSVGWTDHVGVMRGLVEGQGALGEWKDKLMEDPTQLMTPTWPPRRPKATGAVRPTTAADEHDARMQDHLQALCHAGRLPAARGALSTRSTLDPGPKAPGSARSSTASACRPSWCTWCWSTATTLPPPEAPVRDPERRRCAGHLAWPPIAPGG
jgi:hypothetical protein